MMKALGCLAFGVLAGFLAGWGVSEIGKTRQEREFLNYIRRTQYSGQPFRVILVPDGLWVYGEHTFQLRVNSQGQLFDDFTHILDDPSDLGRGGGKTDVIQLSLMEAESKTPVEGLVKALDFIRRAYENKGQVTVYVLLRGLSRPNNRIR